MIATILIVSLAFYWLLRETDYFRIHLIRGPYIIDYRAKWLETFEPYGFSYSETPLTIEDEIESRHYHPEITGYRIRQSLDGRAKTRDTYEVLLSPNVEPMCGNNWLDENWNNLKDYSPRIYMSIGNVRYDMTIKKPEIIKDIMRVNHLTKREIQALA